MYKALTEFNEEPGGLISRTAKEIERKLGKFITVINCISVHYTTAN